MIINVFIVRCVIFKCVAVVSFSVNLLLQFVSIACLQEVNSRLVLLVVAWCFRPTVYCFYLLLVLHPVFMHKFMFR